MTGLDHKQVTNFDEGDSGLRAIVPLHDTTLMPGLAGRH